MRPVVVPLSGSPEPQQELKAIIVKLLEDIAESSEVVEISMAAAEAHDKLVLLVLL